MLYPAFLYLYRYHLLSNLYPLLPELVEIVADYILYRKPQPVVLISQQEHHRRVDALFTSRTKAEAYLSNFLKGPDWIDEEQYRIYDIKELCNGDGHGLTDCLRDFAYRTGDYRRTEDIPYEYESWIKDCIAEIDPCIN